MDLSTLALAFAVFLIAGTIKGTVGIGLPTAAVGMLSQFADPRLAIGLVVFPLLTTNLWQVLRAGRFIETVKKYRAFAVSLVVVLGATTFALPYVSTNGLVTVLGVVVVLFATTSLISHPRELPEKFDRVCQLTGGVAAGIIGGLTAIWGPPMVIYLLARRTEKDEFVRALGTLLLLGGIPLVFGFFANGMLDPHLGALSALMVVPSLLGFAVGEQLRKLLEADRFRTAVLVMFLIMGLNLLRRAFF